MDAKNKTILAVDDDQDLLEVMKTVLTSEGYNVDTATNGDECHESIAKNKPDLILLDVMMRTETEGFNVAQFVFDSRGQDQGVVHHAGGEADLGGAVSHGSEVGAVGIVTGHHREDGGHDHPLVTGEYRPVVTHDLDIGAAEPELS